MLDVGLMVGFAGIFVATLAGVLGVWMERERDNPPYFAIFFSLLIVFASGIEITRTVISAWNDAAAEDTMAQVLEELSEISANSDNPELASFVGAELSRSNPRILKRVEKKVAAKGGDPAAVKRRAAEGKRAGGAAAGEGKAGKAGGDGAEGKAGKAGGDGAEGKAGKAGGDGAEGKAGKAGGDGAGGDGAEGKAGKAGGDGGGDEGKAGKAGGDGGGDAEGKAGKGKAG
jgi:hypothetical protein